MTPTMGRAIFLDCNKGASRSAHLPHAAAQVAPNALAVPSQADVAPGVDRAVELERGERGPGGGDRPHAAREVLLYGRAVPALRGLAPRQDGAVAPDRCEGGARGGGHGLRALRELAPDLQAVRAPAAHVPVALDCGKAKVGPSHRLHALREVLPDGGAVAPVLRIAPGMHGAVRPQRCEGGAGGTDRRHASEMLAHGGAVPAKGRVAPGVHRAVELQCSEGSVCPAQHPHAVPDVLLYSGAVSAQRWLAPRAHRPITTPERGKGADVRSDANLRCEHHCCEYLAILEVAICHSSGLIQLPSSLSDEHALRITQDLGNLAQ
mmetsp:Transcript_72394/g.212102  ORF Transcript_72394/g.212102 Transcript_72394/m.212102 type:complete len:321 (+) Transcript_72394:310-1272(+)